MVSEVSMPLGIPSSSWVSIKPIGWAARATASRNLAIVSSGFADFLTSRPRSLAIALILLGFNGTPPLSIASNKSLADCTSGGNVTVGAGCSSRASMSPASGSARTSPLRSSPSSVSAGVTKSDPLSTLALPPLGSALSPATSCAPWNSGLLR